MNQLKRSSPKPPRTQTLNNYQTEQSNKNQNNNSKSMYAIAFDLKVANLEMHYPGNSYQNAYGDIGKFLASKGFTRQQGSVYFGDPELIDAVKCVMAANELSKQYPWFKDCVTDIRMLRIEDNNDLTPAL